MEIRSLGSGLTVSMINCFNKGPVGIVLNYITLRTKSVYPAIIVHCIAGIFLNSLVYLAHLS